MYDLIFLVVFTLMVIIFLYIKRKNLKREGIIYLYRTQIGLKFIDYVSKKYKKQLNWIQYFVIFIGYVLMVSMVYLFFKLIYLFVASPLFVKEIKIPPLMPLIPYLPEIFKLDFLPPFYFTYWIIVIAIIAVGHEFSHGIFARLHNINVKSTGFGFLGPFLAAFVEPDEKQTEKSSISAQLSVLAAGSFANVVMAVIFWVILLIFFISCFSPAGVIFNTYSISNIQVDNIEKINGITINQPILDNINQLDLSANMTKITFNNKDYQVMTSEFISELGEGKEEIMAYNDMPAINARLGGVITKINNVEVRGVEDLSREISKYEIGEEIIVETLYNEETKKYNLILEECYNKENKACIGIGFLEYEQTGIMGKMYSLFGFFKQPNVYYKPGFGEFTIFIYNLLWWIVLINISVALVNMLPLGIFDGGRVFYLTMLKLTGSKETSKNLFKYITWFLLFLLALLKVVWFYQIMS